MILIQSKSPAIISPAAPTRTRASYNAVAPCPRWQFLLMSGFIVRGASFAVEIDSESFRDYYNEPVDLRMYDEGSRGSLPAGSIPGKNDRGSRVPIWPY